MTKKIFTYIGMLLAVSLVVFGGFTFSKGITMLLPEYASYIIHGFMFIVCGMYILNQFKIENTIKE